jgi:hypothetical protein
MQEGINGGRREMMVIGELMERPLGELHGQLYSIDCTPRI